MSVRFNL